MREVAIIGAGELGGAVAHALAKSEVARVITLIDESGEPATVAAGKALDIAQAGPVERFATELAGSTDLYRAAGVDLIMVADRFRGGEWLDEDGLALLRRLNQLAPRAIVMCAGATGRDLVERGVRELKMPRRRLLGSAPEALAGAARAMTALALNGSACDVAMSVLGVPPAHVVIPWEDAAAGGFSIVRQLDEPVRRRLERTIAGLWPPGPYALAAAATKVASAIAGRTRQVACCFVAPAGSDAARTRTAAHPVRLGPSGIVEVITPMLSASEQTALNNGVLL
jgi:malate dehydrogenase